MSWTKRQLIDQAFEEIGLPPWVYDILPEQYQSSLRRLDAYVASINANGVRIAYPLPNAPNDSSLDQDTGIPDYAAEALYFNLACRIAPSLGKAVSAETRQFADMSYNNLLNQTVLPALERQLPRTMPRGAGTKPWRNFNNPFVYGPTTELDAGPDDRLELE